jgi:hypothetical protein
MDLPVDNVTEVNVEIEAIWLKAAGEDAGPPFKLPLSETPITVDLLAHGGDNAAILVEDALIEAGDYEWLAMDVNASIDGEYDSYVVAGNNGGGQYEIFVPSGRVRLVSGFEVEPNEALELVFDWSLRDGLIFPPGLGAYLLKPAFRMLETNASGKLHGAIDVGEVAAWEDDDENDCNADVPESSPDYDIGNVVYIFAGHDVAPDDKDAVDGPDAEPIARVDAELSEDDTHYVYETLLGYGDYTVAFTCLGANDDDVLDDSESAETPVVFFEGAANITIDASDVDAEVNFPVQP